MSHRWDCPTDYEARRQGERAQERGEGRWRNPHGDRHHDGSGCADAEAAWNRGYREAQRREEERAEQTQHERMIEAARVLHAREETWAYERQMQEQQDQQYDAWINELQDDAYEAHLTETRDVPRWEDDGGRSA